MSDLRTRGGLHEVVCPHCSKPFNAELIAGKTERHQGFKCPHCRLIVRADRAERGD